MNRKQFVVANLFALVMLTMAFAPISSQQDVHDYDPWTDINGDGKMDGKDIAFTSAKFGTLGDPTRNVTVTNFPTEPQPKTIVVVANLTVTATTAGFVYVGTANVTGYRYVSIFVGYYDSDGVDQDLWYEPHCLGIGSGYAGPPVGLAENFGYYETGIRGVEVAAPSLDFEVYSYLSGAIQLSIVLYCYN